MKKMMKSKQMPMGVMKMPPMMKGMPKGHMMSEAEMQKMMRKHK